MRQVLFDFADPAALEGWRSVNDPVMGGVSESSVSWRAGRLAFRGTVSLDNGGGFAATLRRLGPADAPLVDLRQGRRIRLAVEGDGRTYIFRLRSAAAPDIVYHHRFATVAGPQTVTVPFTGFEPESNRGQPVPSAAAIDLSQVTEYGLLIADEQSGPFALEVASISLTG